MSFQLVAVCLDPEKFCGWRKSESFGDAIFEGIDVAILELDDGVRQESTDFRPYLPLIITR